LDRWLKNEVFPRIKLERNILQTTKTRLAKWICHILRRKCLLKHVIDGKIDRKIAGKGRRGRKRKHVLDELKGKEKVVELERGSTKSHSVRNSLWKRLWTCR
jgi:hypothetical protein